jgi:predicted nuclease of predicted toxin-antitoxin system
MRFKIDENLHDDVAVLLTDRGHDVHTVHAEGLKACDDDVLANHCQIDGRALVTLDLDFADIRSYPPVEYAGIVVLRIVSQGRPSVLRVMARVADLLDREQLVQRLWIVTDASIRIRGG